MRIYEEVSIDVACEYCGWTGVVQTDIVDREQCLMCGEILVPQKNTLWGN
jgi:ribosomal protein S27E